MSGGLFESHDKDDEVSSEFQEWERNASPRLAFYNDVLRRAAHYYRTSDAGTGGAFFTGSVLMLTFALRHPEAAQQLLDELASGPQPLERGEDFADKLASLDSTRKEVDEGDDFFTTRWIA